MAIILPSTSNSIKLAAEAIKLGKLVAFPTETVYGIGANAYLENAIRNIYIYKNRPLNKPLIALLSSQEEVEEHFIINETFKILYKAFMPGALTLILQKKYTSKISPISAGGLTEQGFRIPNNPIALALIKAAGVPIVAPSANISNSISPTNSMIVLDNFKNHDVTIIDGGSTSIGIESTIINIVDPNDIKLVRHGAISIESIEQIGLKINAMHSEIPNKKINIKATVILNSTAAKKGEGLLAFGKINFTLSSDVIMLNLSEQADLTEAAKNLFFMLHKLDSIGILTIHIAPIPEVGIGKSINTKISCLCKNNKYQ